MEWKLLQLANDITPNNWVLTSGLTPEDFASFSKHNLYIVVAFHYGYELNWDEGEDEWVGRLDGPVTVSDGVGMAHIDMKIYDLVTLIHELAHVGAERLRDRYGIGWVPGGHDEFFLKVYRALIRRAKNHIDDEGILKDLEADLEIQRRKHEGGSL